VNVEPSLLLRGRWSRRESGGLAAGCGERDLTVEHVERLVLAMAERRLAARVMASISDLAEESRAKTSSA
jgi:hypothetical protein